MEKPKAVLLKPCSNEHEGSGLEICGEDRETVLVSWYGAFIRGTLQGKPLEDLAVEILKRKGWEISR